MDKKERKQIEVTLKNILYFIDDSEEQQRVIKVLENCENKMPDSKIKNAIDRIIKKFKTDYYSIVDHLVDDILSSPIGNKEKQTIFNMLNELKPSIEKGNKSFFEKLIDLFKWS
ncbi:MAG: hypothetical protein K2M08_01000 [Anaeroplasmataceae bacterium]|nr:hypothetical protein [Anaeroplasmataceae bacterium]